MKKTLTFFLMFLIVTAAFAQQRRIVRIGGDDVDTSNWPQPDLKPGLTDAQIAEAIPAYVQRLVDAGHFSGVVLAAKNGKPVVSKAWGMANIEAKTPNTLDTRFNIGSINKLFTKVAIGQLADAGKLSLDDTIRKHLPNYPSAVADRITIAQMLNHRSGLGDIFGARYDAAPPSRLRELSDFLPLFADQPLRFEPGASQQYSNAGYIVLGLIIEKISGQKYRDYVQRNVFAPAGMTSTSFDVVEKATGRATGYTARGGGSRKPNTASLPGRPSSAGGAFSTAADLVRFFEAAVAGKLLSPERTRWMFNGPVGPTNPPAFGAGGGADGVNATVELEDGWTVVALSNYDPPAANATAQGVMKIIRGRDDAEGGEDGGPQLVRRSAPTAPESTDLKAPVAVPLTWNAHLLVVEAKVNGQGPFKFEIDSGASGLMRVTPELAAALKLEKIGEAMAGDPSGKNMERRPIYSVDTVEIGGARFGGVHATTGGRLVGGDTSGVIGLGLFGKLTATIDYPKMQLRLDREPVRGGVPFTSERGIPEIELDLGGTSIKVDVDTGSPATIVIPTSWASKFQLGEVKVVGRARTSTNEFEVKGADLKGDLRVAGTTMTAPRVDLVDQFPVANLGSKFLREYAVTFDMVNKRMALSK